MNYLLKILFVTPQVELMSGSLVRVSKGRSQFSSGSSGGKTRTLTLPLRYDISNSFALLSLPLMFLRRASVTTDSFIYLKCKAGLMQLWAVIEKHL